MVDTSKINAFVNALNSKFENKQSNKKTDISGDFSSDTTSYPTVKAVKDYISGVWTTATTTAAGLMSSNDKTKLDNIEVEANKYVHPSQTARTGKPAANQTPTFGGTVTVSQVTNDNQGHVTGMTDRTITIPSTTASTTEAGLMSPTDKTKLDSISTNANQVTIDTALSGISTNPVQNKVIKEALDVKADTDDIPTKTSELTNDSGFITSSSVPSASSATPSADTTNGSVGTGTTWARSNHTHPRSSLYAEANHTHDSIYPVYVIDNLNVDDVHYAAGHLHYESFSNAIYYSDVDGIGNIDKELAVKGDLPTIIDNLTTNDATKVLSAKQGKILNDLIGDAIDYVNR